MNHGKHWVTRSVDTCADYLMAWRKGLLLLFVLARVFQQGAAMQVLHISGVPDWAAAVARGSGPSELPSR